jgi:hypothetical protein
VFLLCPRAQKLLWDVPADAGFLCDAAYMLRGTVKWTLIVLFDIVASNIP